MNRRRAIHPQRHDFEDEDGVDLFNYKNRYDNRQRLQQSNRQSTHFVKSRKRLRKLSRLGNYIYKGKLMPCHTQLLIIVSLMTIILTICYEYEDEFHPIGKFVHKIVGPPKGFVECDVVLREDPIENTIPFWDSEVHFWDPIHNPQKGSLFLQLFKWMRKDWREQLVASITFSPHIHEILGDSSIAVRPYTAGMLRAEYAGHDVSIGATAVESSWGYYQTKANWHELRWLGNQFAVGDEYFSSFSIAPFVDFRDAHVTHKTLSYILSQQLKVKSVRFPLAAQVGGVSNPWSLLNIGPNLSQSLHWRANFAQLNRYNLGFEAFVYHPQLDQIVSLAREYPGITVILNHAGGPFQCETPLVQCTELVDSLTKLAELPNVMVKVSGFGMPSVGLGYHKLGTPPSSKQIEKDVGGLVHHIVSEFGPKRVMFGTNFPYDLVSFPLSNIINAYKRILSRYNSSDRRNMMYGNAAQFYNGASN